MGYYLRKSFDDKYYSVGFGFNKGTFLAVKGSSSFALQLVRRVLKRYRRVHIESFSLPASPANSFSARLSAIGIGAFMIDLRTSTNPFFAARQVAYQVGAVYMNRRKCFYSFIPNETFDGFIFVDDTHATSLLPY